MAKILIGPGIIRGISKKEGTRSTNVAFHYHHMLSQQHSIIEYIFVDLTQKKKTYNRMAYNFYDDGRNKHPILNSAKINRTA